jgi:DNA (cytosine-5)-methyltransferase 1
MAAYYNEIDAYAAQWLRNLVAKNLIAPGDVDERSITDVSGDDLRGYAQCHFFAGIGGWSYAARLAGWPDDKPLWTGSPPCQPFSLIGKQKGTADERHLWPKFFNLISARRPATVMGEQVAAAVGKDWLDGVYSDLETIGYSCGSAVVPACAVDAPHRRDRLWFVAVRNVDNRFGARLERHAGDGCGGDEWARPARPTATPSRTVWGGATWAVGADGKARRVEPTIRLLAHGVSARVGKLRAFGNAVVPQVAAEVIAAFMESECDAAEAASLCL